jgi:hypothetical protein
MACPLGLCAIAEGRATVAEVHDWLAQVACECARATREEASIHHFTDWVDRMPRAEMRQALLGEVQLELARRQNEDPEDDAA